MGHDDPPTHIINECTLILCAIGTTRHTIHIHGRIVGKYAHSTRDDVIENVSAWPGAVHAGETPTHSIERYIGSGQFG